MTIRTANKRHQCDNRPAHDAGNPRAIRCARYIEPGEQYKEGASDPYRAGGFGRERFCLPCYHAGEFTE